MANAPRAARVLAWYGDSEYAAWSTEKADSAWIGRMCKDNEILRADYAALKVQYDLLFAAYRATFKPENS